MTNSCTDIVRPDPPRCPMCGKLHKVKENVYQEQRNPETGLVIANLAKVKIGERPARNLYAPFCSLRCGWEYGLHHFKKGRKKHG